MKKLLSVVASVLVFGCVPLVAMISSRGPANWFGQTANVASTLIAHEMLSGQDFAALEEVAAAMGVTSDVVISDKLEITASREHYGYLTTPEMGAVYARVVELVINVVNYLYTEEDAQHLELWARVSKAIKFFALYVALHDAARNSYDTKREDCDDTGNYPYFNAAVPCPLEHQRRLGVLRAKAQVDVAACCEGSELLRERLKADCAAAGMPRFLMRSDIRNVLYRDRKSSETLGQHALMALCGPGFGCEYCCGCTEQKDELLREGGKYWKNKPSRCVETTQAVCCPCRTLICWGACTLGCYLGCCAATLKPIRQTPQEAVIMRIILAITGSDQMLEGLNFKWLETVEVGA